MTHTHQVIFVVASGLHEVAQHGQVWLVHGRALRHPILMASKPRFMDFLPSASG